MRVADFARVRLMKTTTEKCPFEVGELVIYKPTPHGLAADAMAGPDGKLVPGKTYKVLEIQQDFYVLVEGYHNPGDGIYWTEFAGAS